MKWDGTVKSLYFIFISVEISNQQALELDGAAFHGLALADDCHSIKPNGTWYVHTWHNPDKRGHDQRVPLSDALLTFAAKRLYVCYE